MSWMTALLKNKTWLNVRVQSFRIIDSISRRCPYCAESRSDHVYASLSRPNATAVISRVCVSRTCS